jgi:hypothetical protein
MHPELLLFLAAERRRDLAAAMTTRPVLGSTVFAGTGRSARAAWRLPRLTLPRFRVSWTRTTLAAVAGRRRGSSVVIVISATRAPGPAPAVAAPSDRAALVKAL